MSKIITTRSGLQVEVRGIGWACPVAEPTEVYPYQYDGPTPLDVLESAGVPTDPTDAEEPWWAAIDRDEAFWARLDECPREYPDPMVTFGHPADPEW